MNVFPMYVFSANIFLLMCKNASNESNFIDFGGEDPKVKNYFP